MDIKSNQNKNIIFAVENFGANKKIYIKDINEISKLLNLLYKLDSQEISLTKDGLDYLINNYGLDAIVNMILEEINRGVDYKYREKNQIKQWLTSEAQNYTDSLTKL